MNERAAKERWYLLKAVCESKRPAKHVCEARGRSTDYFEKWARRLIETKSVEALRDRSRKPKTSPRRTSEQMEKWVVRLKRKHPAYGPERISFYMKLRYKAQCPPSTVYAILRRAGLINKKYRASRTKAHTKRYRRPWPGWLQIDVKYVPYRVLGKQLYQFSAIDHHSSWRCVRIYEEKTEAASKAFLDEVEAACPFEILQIQTDNGTEFTDKFSAGRGERPTGSHAFDRWFEVRGIQHKLIPVGEKELNGKVENSHKYDDEEFYAFCTAKTPEEMKAAAIEHGRFWNCERHTKTLGWRTPEECVETCQIAMVAWIYALRGIDLANALKAKPKLATKATQWGSVVAPAGSISFKPEPKPPKPPTYVDRYLRYLDWEERRSKLKALAPLPPMSPIFPVLTQRF